MEDNKPGPEDFLTNLQVQIDGVPDALIQEFSVNEVSMTESLLTPGLQTTITVQSKVNTEEAKDLSKFANREVTIAARRPIITKLFPDRNYVDSLLTTQRIYRLSGRKLFNYQLEEFRLELCDPSLLVDAKTWVKKSWDCKTPSEIVADVLKQCVGTTEVNIEDTGPRKMYFATGLHPFQVITQQEEMALAGGRIDPSLLHFMTYQNENRDNKPTHNFRSLTKMAQQRPSFEFFYSGKNTNAYNYAVPQEIMQYSFPCDFDTLSDILNGQDINGDEYSQITMFNPNKSTSSVFTSKTGVTPASSPCGDPPWFGITNLGSGESDCKTINSEAYLPIRKARMGLLEQDKVALRMVVPWNPNLSAGRVIDIKIPNTNPGAKENSKWNYGSGKYLIVSMTHNIKMGGLGTTTLECVADTVANGVV